MVSTRSATPDDQSSAPTDPVSTTNPTSPPTQRELDDAVVLDGNVTHVLEYVLGVGLDHPVAHAFRHEEYINMDFLVNERTLVLENMGYLDENDQHVTLRKSHIREIKFLVRYYKTFSDEHGYLDWTAVTRESFEEFFHHPANARYAMLEQLPPDSTAHPDHPSHQRHKLVNQDLVTFKKSIKLNPDSFPVLNNEAMWESWNRETNNQAAAQMLKDVFDLRYNPTSFEKELFQMRQEWVYALFDRTLKCGKAKEILRKYSSTRDAQSVYRDLCAYFGKSTKRELTTSELLSYILNIKYDNSWKGTSQSFLLHWTERVRLYDEITQSSNDSAHQPLTPSLKLIVLKQAVYSVPEFRAISGNADTLHAAGYDGKGNANLGFDAYYRLLSAQSLRYDYARSTKKSASTGGLFGTVEGFAMEQGFPQYEAYPTSSDATIEQDFDMDTPMETVLAYQAQQRREASPGFRPPSAVRLPEEQWRQLNPTARSAWLSMDDASKRIIMGSKPSPAPNSRFPPSNRTANLHEISAYDFIQMQNSLSFPASAYGERHDTSAIVPAPPPPPDPNPPTNVNRHEVTTPGTDNSTARNGTDNQTGSEILSPMDLRRALSQSMNQNSYNNRNCYSSNTVEITYNVSNSNLDDSSNRGALLDRGCNGCFAGSDLRPIGKSHRTVNVTGLANKELHDVPIGTAAGTCTDVHGEEVIVIFHETALYNKGSSMLSCAQIEHNGWTVDDRSAVVGGSQHLKSPCGRVFPLQIRNGLPRLDIRPYTDSEWNSLPQVHATTSGHVWDPRVLDTCGKNGDEWFDALQQQAGFDTSGDFDEYGNSRFRVVNSAEHFYCTRPTERSDGEYLINVVDRCIYYAFDTHSTVPGHVHKTKEPDYEMLRPMFGWLNTNVIQKTFKNTTQYAHIPNSEVLKKHYKSPNPVLNVHRRQEDIATDSVFANCPAIDDGSTCAQIFVGCSSMVTDVKGMKSADQFINTLEDIIRERGAPTRLLSDRGKNQISEAARKILRTYFIGDWQSEPYQQHQNPAERRYQTVKNLTNIILDRTGALPSTWLLCLEYVCTLLNHTYNNSIKMVPLQALDGSTVDISAFLRFHFWQTVYYKVDDSDFPSDSREERGRMVGIARNVGHALTYRILTDTTQKVIYRSNCRPADPKSANLRLDPIDGENDTPSNPVLKSRFDFGSLGRPPGTHSIRRSDGENFDDSSPNRDTLYGEDNDNFQSPLCSAPIRNPHDLIGRTFLLPKQGDGQRLRARIVEAIEDHDAAVANNNEHKKFRLSINNDEYEDIMSYNEIAEHIMRDKETDVVWRFHRIVAHEGPLTPEHPNYKNCAWNVKVEWENGAITHEPLSNIIADDPVTVAIYAKDNDLLDTPGWKRLKRIANRSKKLKRMANQAKLRSYNTAPRYQYGFEVPRDYDHAVRLDRQNGNTMWQDAIALEMKQLDEYDTFKDTGQKEPPDGYKKIRCHFVFAVKHDGRHKARLVAGGHLTDVPTESVYSGVVSLRGIRLVLFLAELNGLDAWATDVGNAYLEAYTREKVCIKAGPEFGPDLEGKFLIINKALYGLRSSGTRWHDRFADCLRDMGFFPCKAEPDIWMRQVVKSNHKESHYEYIAVYVDDLAIVSKNPKAITDTLENKHKFKLKGTGPITFHLGTNFKRDKEGVLNISAIDYIEKLCKSYKQMFGVEPDTKYAKSPLVSGDHPELDTTELLEAEDITKYQSLIGALQWCVSIGRFDISVAVATLSSFRAIPRRGHLDRARRIVGYLSKMKHGAIRIRTLEPDYSSLPAQDFDWSRSVYGEPEEVIPKDAPRPLGKYVTLSHYVDANLMHDFTTGRSCTGILHMINQTPIDWFSKKQATVETATYGSEFLAARQCVEQIIDLRTTLRYLGVPLRGQSFMFGDNQSVVESAVKIHAKLHKRHTALSFHRVREAIASKMVAFYHIAGNINPADILSKHWGYQQVWSSTLQPLLFWWYGDTGNITNSKTSKK